MCLLLMTWLAKHSYQVVLTSFWYVALRFTVNPIDKYIYLTFLCMYTKTATVIIQKFLREIHFQTDATLLKLFTLKEKNKNTLLSFRIDPSSQEVWCTGKQTGSHKNGLLCSIYITKTYLYNVDPHKPHFYIVKLGFTGVYIFFLISAQKHRLWVLVRIFI